MGQDVDHQDFTGEDRRRYRAKVRRCLDVLARMLTDRDFSVGEPLVGVEIEFNLADASGDAAMTSAEALAAIADEDFQTELGRYNLEINVAPRPIAGEGLLELETTLRDDLDEAERKAAGTGSGLVMVGILPTVREEHFAREVISPDPGGARRGHRDPDRRGRPARAAHRHDHAGGGLHEHAAAPPGRA